MLKTNNDNIPADARRSEAVANFDAIGCMLAGAASAHGKIITSYVSRQGGAEDSAVIGTPWRSPTAQAAFANGTLGHALDYDDRGMASHAASIITAALLAVAGKIGSSGADVIEAAVVGREIGHAFGTAYDNAKPFHRMAIFGRLCSTIACAKLMGVDERQTTMALGIVGSMASGVCHSHGTMTKPLHSGLAARDGVVAAELAADGWTAGEQILEHPAGMIEAFCGEGVDLRSIVDRLGNPFLTPVKVGIKRYPCGGANHRQIDAILAMMKAHNFDYRDVEEVEVVQGYNSSYTMIRRPRTGLEGKFSMIYIPAATLVQGFIDIDTFTDERIGDPRIQDTMNKIRLRILDRWEVGLDRAAKKWPGGSSGHTNRGVTIRLKDGRTLTENIDADELLGFPSNPWGFDNIRAKFESNARLVLPEAQATEAAEVWSDFDKIEDIRQAMNVLMLTQ
jgi:2-methylcitrate dehydratase PrpD